MPRKERHKSRPIWRGLSRLDFLFNGIAQGLNHEEIEKEISRKGELAEDWAIQILTNRALRLKRMPPGSPGFDIQVDVEPSESIYRESGIFDQIEIEVKANRDLVRQYQSTISKRHHIPFEKVNEWLLTKGRIILVVNPKTIDPKAEELAIFEDYSTQLKKIREYHRPKKRIGV